MNIKNIEITNRDSTRATAARIAGMLFLAATAAPAAVITVPPGLSPGASYRLVFVTTGVAPATSSDIADYDNFVVAQVAVAPDLVSLGTQWRVLGSTNSVAARTHTDTDPGATVGVPVYNLAGQLVAGSNADLWDGTLANPIAYDQSGTLVTQKVFTGTGTDGAAIPNREFGAVGDRVQYGEANLANSGWTTIDWLGDLTELHYYGISDVLTVVPEPSVAVLLSGLFLAGLRRRRFHCALP